MSDTGLPSIALIDAFELEGSVERIECLKRGHINNTFISTCRASAGGPVRRYIHQKINTDIFRNVPELMRTIQRVTAHVRECIERTPGSMEQALTIVPTRAGTLYLQTATGECWRTYRYIDESYSVDVCRNPQQAYAAAQALGAFQGYLCDLNPTEFAETIPGFQDTGGRYQAFEAALKADRAQRAAAVVAEIEFAKQYRTLGALVSRSMREGDVPVRVTHADPKLNNVLFSKQTDRAVAIVDLDTCSPGSLLYDFGDFARCTSVPTAEDEQDLAKIKIDLDLFEAITRGYLGALAGVVTAGERHHCADAPACLGYTLGLRFLTDHLNGDVYFQVHRPNQNLDRARAQFQVARGFMEVRPKIAAIIAAVKNA